MPHQDVKHRYETKSQHLSVHTENFFHLLIKELEALSITITIEFQENILNASCKES